MNNLNPVATYALRLGDNGPVLAQRLGAWCGHAPGWRLTRRWQTWARPAGSGA